MRAVAERVELPRGGGERHGRASQRTSARERGRSRRTSTTPGRRAGQPLDEPDAGGAVDALEIELGGREAVGGRPAGAGLEAGVVELGVAPLARLKGFS